MYQELKTDNKKILYISSIIIIILLGCAFCYIAITHVNKEKISVSESALSTYSVLLKDNRYFSSTDTGNAERYITEALEKVKTAFSYQANLEGEGDIHYRYQIESELVITEENDQNHKLWSKKDLLTAKEGTSENGNLKINDEITINYHDYNNIVKEFSQGYQLRTKANLKINFKIKSEVSSKKLKNPADLTKTISVNIPLNEQTILITATAGKPDSILLEEVQDNLSPLAIICWILTIASFIGTLYFVYKLVTLTYNEVKTDSEFTKTLKKILRNYDEIIVSTTRNPSIINTKVIDVVTFEELLDAQEELRKPITFYKDPHKAIFIIMDENTSWRYILTNKR